MLLYNLRLAWISLRRTPFLSALAVGAIGLGIAVAVACTTIYYMLARDPLPGKSDTLHYVRLDSWNPARPWDDDRPELPPTQVTYRDAMAMLESDVPARKTASFEADLVVRPEAADQRPFNLQTRLTTRDFFAMFEAPMRWGDAWSGEADRDGQPVAVLSDERQRTDFRRRQQRRQEVLARAPHLHGSRCAGAVAAAGAFLRYPGRSARRSRGHLHADRAGAADGNRFGGQLLELGQRRRYLQGADGVGDDLAAVLGRAQGPGAEGRLPALGGQLHRRPEEARPFRPPAQQPGAADDGLPGRKRGGAAGGPQRDGDLAAFPAGGGDQPDRPPARQIPGESARGGGAAGARREPPGDFRPADHRMPDDRRSRRPARHRRRGRLAWPASAATSSSRPPTSSTSRWWPPASAWPCWPAPSPGSIRPGASAPSRRRTTSKPIEPRS